MGVGAPRAVSDDVLPPKACNELLLIARCCSAVGYRENHCAATLFDVLRIWPAWLEALVRARERVRAAAEQAFNQPLLIEFTGLTSWRPCAAIDWHHDANRDYLEQREFAAVAYLNTAGQDFEGGTFEFKGGEPAQVPARPGRCVLYSASTVHRVTEITAGERFTLTIWFTTQPDHDEDAKLLRTLREAQRSGATLPPPPPSMFALPGGGSESIDLRLCRLAIMGLGLGRRQDDGALQLLLSLDEEEQGGVHMVLHRPTLAQWSGCPGAAGLEMQAPLVELPGGGLFPSAWHAIVGLQAWVRLHSGGKWGAEAVCSRHLSGGAGGCAGRSCDWLRQCAAQPSGVLAAHEQALLADMVPCVRRHLASIGGAEAQWQALQRQWLQLGGVFPC